MTTMSAGPLLEIIARVLGQPPGRFGDRSSRPWWSCPFHPDPNPSLSIIPDSARWKCFGCGLAGDGIDFIRRLNPSMTFSEAVAAVGGGLPARPPSGHRPPPRPRRPEPKPRPDGWHAFARRVVEKAERQLWGRMGLKALAYLRGRGLVDETIRAARLGLVLADTYDRTVFPATPKDDGRVWIPAGLVIPWLDGEAVEAVEAVNVRRPDGAGKPKYVLLRGSRRGIYPGREAVRIGRPLVIVEGEFDDLLLGQELGDLAAVVTLGSAGDKPDTKILRAFLEASPWIVAGDADGAGKASADGWLARSGRCRRIAPPDGYGKDWTEARQRGLNLRGWWAESLGSPDPAAAPPVVVPFPATRPEVTEATFEVTAPVDDLGPSSDGDHPGPPLVPPIQLRPHWVMTAAARFVEVPEGSTIPLDAIYECREGDERWTPIEGRRIRSEATPTPRHKDQSNHENVLLRPLPRPNPGPSIHRAGFRGAGRRPGGNPASRH